MLLTVSTNIARGPFQGYVPGPRRRGPGRDRRAPWSGMMQILGNVTGLVLANLAAISGNLELALFAVAIVELVTMLSVVLKVGKGMPPKSARRPVVDRDRRRDVGDRHPPGAVVPVAGRLPPVLPDRGGILFAYVTVVHEVRVRDDAGGGRHDQPRPDRRGRARQPRGDRAGVAPVRPDRAQAGHLRGLRGSARPGPRSPPSRRPSRSRSSAARCSAPRTASSWPSTGR